MSGSKKRPAESANGREENEGDPISLDELEFEDPYGDEFDDDEFDEEQALAEEAAASASAPVAEGDSTQNSCTNVVPPPACKQVWRPGIDKLEHGEDLEYDPSAYIMYHALRTEWPCLSFDIIKDNLGDNRQRFPLTMFMVTGSQADRADRNKVTLLKVSDMNKTHVKADSDSDEDEEEDDEDDDAVDEDPAIEHVNVNHQGGVNRVRSMPQAPGVVATMSDTSAVHVFDLRKHLASMMTKGPRVTTSSRPTYSYTGHEDEGFALDWSPTVAGRLATGDCAGKIRIWQPTAAGSGSDSIGTWSINPSAFTGHESSVEDIQWSPTEASVFISASADKTVRVWDIRDSKKSQITFQAHGEDVNVISWNKNVGYLLASGSDDGSFKVWDLRTVQSGGVPLAHFTYHKAPITSIEWAPHDESMLALSSADDQLTIWDLSVEADDDAAAAAADAGVDAAALADFPPQLLFIHQGQSNMKEVHFHPQIHGVLASTAEDGFNIFKPAISVSS